MSAIRDQMNAMKCRKCDTDHVTRATLDHMNAIRDLMNAIKCRKCSSNPRSQL
jgi:ribosomal protein L40E